MSIENIQYPPPTENILYLLKIFTWNAVTQALDQTCKYR